MNPAGRPPAFAVGWTDPSVEDLTEAYTVYFTRGEGHRVTAAERIVNTLLADDPVRNGRPVAEGLFRLTVSPLVVSYEVDVLARQVRVTSIRYFA